MAKRGSRNRRRVDSARQGEKRRRALRRLGRLASRALLLLALCAGGAVGAGLLYRWALHSPTFALEHVTFTGLHRASAPELSKLSGLSIGQNLLTLDVPGLARAMTSHPWVKQVEMTRHFPRGLAIAVEEYVPVAIAVLGDLYLVGSEGEPFKRIQTGDSVDLPVLTGLDRDGYVADPKSVSTRLKAAMDVAQAYARSAYGRQAPLSEVQLSQEGLTLVVGKLGQEIHLGEGGTAEKLARLSQVAHVLEGRALVAEVIHLENRARPGWVAVKTSTPGSERAGARMK